jgi:putative addiction module killer protein
MSGSTACATAVQGFVYCADLRRRNADFSAISPPVGDGVYEMREAFGPGWRMYYLHRGTELILMLGGGDKSSQTADIEAAKALAADLLE